MSGPAFAGSIPENYHRNLGPLLFEPYARDMAARVSGLRLAKGARVLEMACGTGIVTRALLGALPEGAALVATDVSGPMIEQARRNVPADPRVSFAQADACALPFKDGEFDAIVCQYGVMFFPDKVKAMREARRVLRAGGVYLFSAWDSFETNPIPGAVQAELERAFPGNAPAFLKTPYGWHDRAEIERVVRAGGFAKVSLTAVEFPSVAPSAEAAARGCLEGTPLTAELVERKADIGALVRAVTASLAGRFGSAPCRATMRAFVVEAR